MDTAVASLPDPRRFDPVRFPGAAAHGEWPPPRFDFAAPAMKETGLRFERDAGGGIAVVRQYDHLRLLLDIDRVHLPFEIAPGSRDFLLLRLIPAALRHAETIACNDPVPPALRDEDVAPPEEHHVYAATTALTEVLAGLGSEEAAALSDAIRRVPPGLDMFEQAVARCVTRDRMPLERIAPLARRLQRLANAHAGALAAAASQPDYVAMERAVRHAHAIIGSDRRWAHDLLTLALGSLLPKLEKPRITAEKLLRGADAALRQPGALHNLTAMIERQQAARDRLSDLALFWNRTVIAWLAVHPETTDRRDVEALARNALRRLSLQALYAN